MNKKILGALLSTLMVVSFAGCGLKSPTTETVKEGVEKETATPKANQVEPTAGESEITLVYAEVNPLDTIVGQTGTAFNKAYLFFRRYTRFKNSCAGIRIYDRCSRSPRRNSRPHCL